MIDLIRFERIIHFYIFNLKMKSSEILLYNLDYFTVECAINHPEILMVVISQRELITSNFLIKI